MGKNRSGESLRSSQWMQLGTKDGYVVRSYTRKLGVPEDMLEGRPVIGICNTWSDLTPCNSNLRQLAEFVKRGVYEAGGLPMEFPVMSLGETHMRPTAMMFRNLVSMDVEESIRANPLDGVVLLVGCDKTTPALLMGAASCDLPALVVSSGPMLNGKWRGQNVGSGTSLFQWFEDVRAGTMTEQELRDTEHGMSRSEGTCMTMGTASTMACMTESLGMSLAQNAAIPAPDTRRHVLAHMTGRRIVEMVKDDLKMSKVLTKDAFENAIVTCSAIGGSTNALVHLIALAGRIGVDLTLEDWDRVSSDVPCLLNLMPSGEYLMEDFYYNGGLPALLNEIRDFLHLDAVTVSGHTLEEQIAGAERFGDDVIKTVAEPFSPTGGIAVLGGNLAPNGAVIKPTAATPALCRHRGRAVVFEDIDDYKRRIDLPDLDVEPDDVLVLKNCGPKGYPGFPEVGNMGLPAKLLARGVKDMVRISDSRMSGTAFGTVVLHVAPEAAAGGPLAVVQNGDLIELNVDERRLHLDVPAEEIARRREGWQGPEPHATGGYQSLFLQHVLQADQGCDFDFLRGCRGAGVPKPYL